MSDRAQNPTGWQTICLGKHAIIKARLGWKGLKADEYTEDGYIFLATPNLKGRRIDFENVDHISKWRYEESPEIQLRLGDVLIVKDGSTLGISNYVRHLPRPTTVNGSIAVVRVDDTIDSEFLYHFVNGDEFQYLITLKKAGLGVPHLFQADLRRFDISLPPLPEQRRIARILTTLDNLIEKTEALIAKYQAIKQGMMHDLFTRGVDAHGHLRPTQAEAPKLYKQSQLGWIPKDWDFASLGAIAEVASGVTLGRKLSGTQVVELPYLRVANVQDGYLDLTELKTVAVLKDEIVRFELQPGDMLMTEGGDFDKLGRGTVWRGQIHPCLHQNHIFRVRPARDFITPDFLACVTASSHGKRYFLVSSKQTTNLATINSTQLKAFPVPLPKLDEQIRLTETLSAIDRQIDTEQRLAAQLKQTKTGLMQDLLTGKVRVNVDEAEEVVG